MHCTDQSVILCENILKRLSLPNCKSQGAEIWRECSPLITCQMSNVRCHMSHVTCHVSCVTKFWTQLVEYLLSTGPTPSIFWVSNMFIAEHTDVSLSLILPCTISFKVSTLLFLKENQSLEAICPYMNSVNLPPAKLPSRRQHG